jgi:hypothetical protein
MPHPDKDDPDNNAEVPAQQEITEKDIDDAKKELKQAIHGSQEVLCTATTVFPFTPFPDTVTIDRAKLTITHRSFFKIAEIMSIRIEDILNVTANVGPLFGSLRIVSRVLSPDKPYQINFLWRADAMKMKRIMQGYIIAMQKEIDVTPLETKELAKMLDDLGGDDHPAQN